MVFYFCRSPFFRFFCRQSFFFLFIFIHYEEKKETFFYNNYGIRALIIYFYCILIDMYIYVYLCVFMCIYALN